MNLWPSGIHLACSPLVGATSTVESGAPISPRAIESSHLDAYVRWPGPEFETAAGSCWRRNPPLCHHYPGDPRRPGRLQTASPAEAAALGHIPTE
jgi:hypothetical protein